MDKEEYSRLLLMKLHVAVAFLKSNFAISDRSHILIAFDLVISVLASYNLIAVIKKKKKSPIFIKLQLWSIALEIVPMATGYLNSLLCYELNGIL